MRKRKMFLVAGLFCLATVMTSCNEDNSDTAKDEYVIPSELTAVEDKKAFVDSSLIESKGEKISIYKDAYNNVFAKYDSCTIKSEITRKELVDGKEVTKGKFSKCILDFNSQNIYEYRVTYVEQDGNKTITSTVETTGIKRKNTYSYYDIYSSVNLTNYSYVDSNTTLEEEDSVLGTYTYHPKKTVTGNKLIRTEYELQLEPISSMTRFASAEFIFYSFENDKVKLFSNEEKSKLYVEDSTDLGLNRYVCEDYLIKTREILENNSKNKRIYSFEFNENELIDTNLGNLENYVTFEASNYYKEINRPNTYYGIPLFDIPSMEDDILKQGLIEEVILKK